MNDLKFSFGDISPIAILGVNNVNLRLIQLSFPKLKIMTRGSELSVKGEPEEIDRLAAKLSILLEEAKKRPISEERIIDLLSGKSMEEVVADGETNTYDDAYLLVANDGKVIRARTPNQKKLLEASTKNDMVFAIGPAGTGKTYTSVAIAVKALKARDTKRIIITRPAVEAGENLGFLPGDLKEKIDPYLRPVYDALDDMIPPEKLKKYFEDRVIEVAPLAFMRGRTLNNAYVILDEAQNATSAQLKMFLTRMGPNAKFMINGDLTQIDLPKKSHSGLIQAIQLLRKIEGIAIVELSVADVMRHRLVKAIVTAYDGLDKL